MAQFTISIDENIFWVDNTFTTITDCASVFEYAVTAEDTEEIVITLSGDHSGTSYISNGVETAFSDTVTLNYNTSLIIRFTLLNSAVSGYFNEASIIISNSSTLSAVTSYTFVEERENDNPLCGKEGGTTLSLTTIGTTGAATLIADVLNIPIYGGLGAGGQVDTVNSGTDITVDNTDPVNPIVNFTGTYFTPTDLITDYAFSDNSTNWNTAFGWGDHAGLYLPIGTQLAQTKVLATDEYFTSYDATTGLFTTAVVTGGATPTLDEVLLEGNTSTTPILLDGGAGASGSYFTATKTDGASVSLGFTDSGTNNGAITFGNAFGGTGVLRYSDTATTPNFFNLPEPSFGSHIIPISISDGVTTLTPDSAGDINISSILGSGGVTDHTLLTNIGTNTHAQIDSHIADATIHFTQASISITESQVSDLGPYNNYVHPTGDGNLHVPANSTTNDGKVLTAGATAGLYTWETIPAGVTDHTLLSNIGTNTHAQIDTHIADATIHFTQAQISITESQISDLTHFVPTNLLTDYSFTDNSVTWNALVTFPGFGTLSGDYGYTEPTHALADLTDVDATVGSPTDGKILVYRTAGTDWVLEDKPIPGGGGATQLNELSDVTNVTYTNRHVLIADGVDYDSRALVEADISDLGTYLTTLAFAGLSDYPTNAIGALTNDGAGNLTWAASGSSLPVVDTTAVVKGSVDDTKLLRFEVDGITTSTTRVITQPDYDVNLNDVYYIDGGDATVDIGEGGSPPTYGGASPITTAYKTADESKVSDNTQVLDTDLQMELEANSVYNIQASWIVSGDSTSDFRWLFEVPTGASGNYADGVQTSAGSAGIITFATAKTIQTTSSIKYGSIVGIITTTDAGTFGLKWSQGNLNVASTTLYKGSNIILTKLA